MKDFLEPHRGLLDINLPDGTFNRRHRGLNDRGKWGPREVDSP